MSPPAVTDARQSRRAQGDQQLRHRTRAQGALATPAVPKHLLFNEPDPARDAQPLTRAERDIAALGIIVAAIILFVATGSQVLIRIMRHVLFGETTVDVLLANALLLNIALLIFGWRRYVELTCELSARRAGEYTALRLAETDALTGCLNRRSFDTALQTMSAPAGDHRGEIAVVLIDLDRFKRCNDLHGHPVGDAVLCETARRIRAMLPHDAVLARLGGDEFAALIGYPAGADSLGETEQIAIRVGSAISRPMHCGDITVSVTASIGLAAGGDNPAGGSDTVGDTAGDAMMHRADVAMYQAKKTGRNRTCRFDPVMERDMLLRCQLERDIREGVEKGEFLPYYEKQVDIATGTLTGFEMLARWHSPKRGLVLPEAFVQVAEDIGIMPELSEALIRRALRDARDWAPHLTLSINIAPVQMRDTWFAQRLLKLLVEARMPPARVEIEITEICLNENLSAVRALATSLHNQGIRLSLDDFGHSYSSLAHLSTLPFDRIKIDRTFIASLIDNHDSATIIAAIASLGQGMDLPVTAEGIETLEILARLRQIGTFHGQGYIYGRPMDAATLRGELAGLNLLANEADPPAGAVLPAVPDNRSSQTG